MKNVKIFESYFQMRKTREGARNGGQKCGFAGNGQIQPGDRLLHARGDDCVQETEKGQKGENQEARQDSQGQRSRS